MSTRQLVRTKPFDATQPLSNLRHEKFAQLYTGDLLGNALASYLASGYKNNPASGVVGAAAHQLLRTPKVWARVSYLRDENLKYIKLHRLDAAQHLGNVVKARVVDFMDENGAISLPKNHPLADAVAEWNVDETISADGKIHRKIKFKLKDSMKALEMLGLSEASSKVDMNLSGDVNVQSRVEFVR